MQRQRKRLPQRTECRKKSNREQKDHAGSFADWPTIPDEIKGLLEKIAKPGLMQKMLSLMPGMGDIRKMLNGTNSDGEMQKMIGVINSMTPAERGIRRSSTRRVAIEFPKGLELLPP